MRNAVCMVRLGALLSSKIFECSIFPVDYLVELKKNIDNQIDTSIFQKIEAALFS